MKIVDHKVKNFIRQPFSAVLIGGEKEDVFLKSLENESHTALQKDHIKNKDERLNATRFINNLNKEIRAKIDEKMEELNPSDGVLDTSDLIYESSFILKNDLEEINKPVSSVSANPITKSSAGNSGKKEKRNQGDGINRGGSVKPVGSGRVRKPRKNTQPSGDSSDYGIIPLLTGEAERISLEKFEALYLKIPGISGYNKCNIIFSVIDGEGVALKANQSSLSSEYTKAYDNRTNKNYKIQGNKILNVDLIDGEVQVNLEYSDKFNAYLKYSYKLEVFNDDL